MLPPNPFKEEESTNKARELLGKDSGNRGGYLLQGGGVIGVVGEILLLVWIVLDEHRDDRDEREGKMGFIFYFIFFGPSFISLLIIPNLARKEEDFTWT